MDKLKQLSKQLLAAKKQAQETHLTSILSKEGKCLSDFYKYVKRRKGNRENIPAIKDSSGRIITDPTEKANSLNFYYSTIFGKERIFSFEGGGCRSHYMEASFWRKLWTCRQTEH